MGDSNPAEELSTHIDAENARPQQPRRSASKANINGLDQYHPALDEAFSGESE